MCKASLQEVVRILIKTRKLAFANSVLIYTLRKLCLWEWVGYTFFTSICTSIFLLYFCFWVGNISNKHCLLVFLGVIGNTQKRRILEQILKRRNDFNGKTLRVGQIDLCKQCRPRSDTAECGIWPRGYKSFLMFNSAEHAWKFLCY